jgi:hypothetical protein
MTEDWIKELVACFESANKDGLDIDKAFMIKHRHLPSCVYKFREVNDYSLNNLAEGTVWLTSPSKYNDPYDCAATLSYSELASASPRAHLEQAIGHSDLKSILPEKAIEDALTSNDPIMEIARKVLALDNNVKPEHIDSMIEDLRRAQAHVMAPYMERLVASVREGIKICSFCATNEPILMWSHYASNHQGFCMEYDVNGFPDIVRRMLFTVIYDASMFDCTTYFAESMSNLDGFNNVFAQLQALYKAPEWSYEKEWRLVFIANVIRDEINYYIGHPKRVYLGAKISEPDRTRVLNICRRNGIDVRLMKLVPNRFELTSDPIC